MIIFVRAEQLWKPRFANACLIISLSCATAGLVLEIIDGLHQPTGATVVIMFFPLAFLGYFQLIRWLFKKWKKTEPYITSASSVIGDLPLDLFTSANKDDKKRKFDKNRRIMLADFVFSFAYSLVPILSFFLLMAWIYGRL